MEGKSRPPSGFVLVSIRQGFPPTELINLQVRISPLLRPRPVLLVPVGPGPAAWGGVPPRGVPPGDGGPPHQPRPRLGVSDLTRPLVWRPPHSNSETQASAHGVCFGGCITSVAFLFQGVYPPQPFRLEALIQNFIMPWVGRGQQSGVVFPGEKKYSKIVCMVFGTIPVGGSL